jgi:hypothetical protein
MFRQRNGLIRTLYVENASACRELLHDPYLRHIAAIHTKNCAFLYVLLAEFPEYARRLLSECKLSSRLPGDPMFANLCFLDLKFERFS